MHISTRGLACLAATLLALASAQPAQAQANTAVGRWRLSFFNDNTPGLAPMAIQDICILANGTWYSPSFMGWRGRWFQKGTVPAGNGDRVRMLGNYANGVGNDGAEIEFVTVNMMTGAWTEWRDFPNAFFVWTRVTLIRSAPTCPPMPQAAPQPNAREVVRNPLDPGGAVPRDVPGRDDNVQLRTEQP
jgi:hypothetical protein